MRLERTLHNSKIKNTLTCLVICWGQHSRQEKDRRLGEVRAVSNQSSARYNLDGRQGQILARPAQLSPPWPPPIAGVFWRFFTKGRFTCPGWPPHFVSLFVCLFVCCTSNSRWLVSIVFKANCFFLKANCSYFRSGQQGNHGAGGGRNQKKP